MKTYTERVFGKVDGKDVVAYRFETEAGYQLEIMTYGATILRYVTPDKAGNFANVILGFDDFDSYVGNSPKHGASVGPVAGRIAGATFELNGKAYELEVNNASNCNHSGSTGWDSSLFELVEVSDHGLTLYTERTDGTGGFPGNLKIWISYYLEESGAYEVSYKVTTDQDTLVNPTNHSYFNLSVISAARRSLRPLLAATPPATTRVLTGYFSKAFLVFAMRISMTAAWKEAHKSSVDKFSPFCSAL